MYILFKSVDDATRGPIQVIGNWLHYTVGHIPDTHVDIIKYDHLNPTVLDEDVALCWKFCGAAKGYISVRDGSLQNHQLEVVSSLEAPGTKVKYYLSQEELENTAKFMKVLMRKMLDEIYDARFVALNAQASSLEQSTWTRQRTEAEAWTLDNTALTPTLDILAQARGIDISTMVNLVIAAAQAYDNQVAALLANKQIMEEAIRSCTIHNDCWVILHTKFGVNMPLPIQQELEMMDVGARFDI